jgi:hypothetical protein
VDEEPRIIHHLSAEERGVLDRQRRHRHRVAEHPDGFTEVADGRSGAVYYREGERVLELSWEMDATRPGILLYVGGLDEWVLPEPQPTSAAERDRLRAALEAGPSATEARSRSWRTASWSGRGRTSSHPIQRLHRRTWATTASNRSRPRAAPSRRTPDGG